MKKPGLFLFSVAGLVLGLGAFQIQPQLNYTENDKSVWVWLKENKNISSVFYCTEYNENKGPTYDYRADPNSGHPWAVEEYLNDTLKLSVIVETHQNETVSDTFKITPTGVNPVRKYSIAPRRPWYCDRPQSFCMPTTSYFNGIPCTCGERMIFCETFENERWIHNWKHMQHSRLPDPYYEFVDFVNNNNNLYVRDNALHLRVTPSNYTSKNPFYLENCTLPLQPKYQLYCGRTFSKKYWPPYNSASIESIASFKYGRIEIEAKVPIGDWLFPVLSLNFDTSHSIRIAMVRGNERLKDNAENEIGGKNICGGATVQSDNYETMQQLSNDKHFGEDFHTYEAIWKKDIIIFKVDGRPYAEITDSHILQELNESARECKIKLGVTVGGEYNFPDSRISSEKKPFKAFRVNSIRIPGGNFIWKHPELVIKSVKVYSITDYE